MIRKPERYLHCLETNPPSGYQMYFVSEVYYFSNSECECFGARIMSPTIFYTSCILTAFSNNKTKSSYGKLSLSYKHPTNWLVFNPY